MRLQYISIYRVVAMMSILVCHIAQSQKNALMGIFNGGVYAFLLVSGMLLGGRDIVSIKEYISKRFKRILMPYYLVIALYMFLYFIVFKWSVFPEAVPNLFCVQWFHPGLEKTGHLWYITCILICYFLVPFLQFFTKGKHLSRALFWFLIGSIGLLCTVLSVLLSSKFLYLGCFAMGYLYSRMYKRADSKNLDIYERIVVVSGMLLMVGRILLEYVLCYPLPGVISDIIEIAFSLSLLLALRMLVHCDVNRKRGGVLHYLDSISYEVYLTHHIFILGPLSVMKLTDSIVANSAIAVMLTIMCARMLNLCVTWLTSALDWKRV